MKERKSGEVIRTEQGLDGGGGRYNGQPRSTVLPSHKIKLQAKKQRMEVGWTPKLSVRFSETACSVRHSKHY
jgi:hypothetical protein